MDVEYLIFPAVPSFPRERSLDNLHYCSNYHACLLILCDVHIIMLLSLLYSIVLLSFLLFSPAIKIKFHKKVHSYDFSYSSYPILYLVKISLTLNFI